jgi:aldehyde dehydrogenase (NAD+)
VTATVEPGTTSPRDLALAALPPTAAYLDGAWHQPTGGRIHLHVNPATGQELGTWMLPTAADVDVAVASTARAQKVWWALTPSARRDALTRLGQQVQDHATVLAALVTLEMGMPYRASLAGVLAAAEWFRHYAGYADKIEGAVPSVVSPSAGLDYTRHAPYGVVAAIIPWNGPVMALALKVAPALAAGNGVVLKPSELAAFSSLHFATLLTSAGLPPGIVNVVPGGPDVGAALCADPRVAMISFTGGGAAGRKVSEAAAARHVPVVMELGGKSASIIFADADVRRASKLAAILGVAQNSGQGCFLPTRLLVERSIYDDVVAGVVAATKTFRLGDPFDPDTTMGPVVDAASRSRIAGVIDGAAQRGDGKIVAGGSQDPDGVAEGRFVEATVFADVDPASPLGQDEVFGPVLSIIAFDDEREAIAIANGTRFGLAGYVWTRDLGRAHRVAEALDAGYVSINSMAALPPGAPFGGWKDSGHGVEGGRAGLVEYLRVKNVHVQW